MSCDTRIWLKGKKNVIHGVLLECVVFILQCIGAIGTKVTKKQQKLM